MNPDHKPQKRLIFGCSGSGKSTMFKRLIQTPGYRYRFIFDWDLKIARELGWTAATNPEGLCRLLDSGKPVVFWPGKMFPAEIDEGFAFFCRFVLAQAERLQGKKLFGADEVGEYVTTNFWKFPPGFRQILSYGRNLEIDLVLAAQSVTDLANRGRRQLTEVYIFKHADADRQAFKEIAEMGIEPDQVKALPHPSTHNKVGYIYRHCLTGRQETIVREIRTDGAAKANR